MDVDSRETGERVVERLTAGGVEYVFATFGTDHPTLIKGLAGEEAPTAVLAPDETLAASAAHGYAGVTGDPQAVLVHVDVGTANLGPALHNAARSHVPMLVLAGRTPHTTRGERPGSRSIFVHWYQDVYDQHGLVREYANWAYELETGANVDRVLARAFDMAAGPPAGPAYLTLPREVLREPAEESPDVGPVARETAPTTASRETRDRLLDRLRAAEDPLLVTSYLGRDEAGVRTLVDFAETVGVPVVEAAPAFDLNFPRDHPLHLGFAAEPWLDDADLVLVAACDVPWVPSRATPAEDATVVHVDHDPEKGQYPMWDFRPDVSVRADPAAVLADLTDAYESDEGTEDRVARAAERHEALRDEWDDAVRSDGDSITPALLSRAIGEAVGPDAVVVDETVTNTVSVLRHLVRTEPGTYYSYCSSGLGWALGASVGVELARPDRTVVTTVGDGSFVLGNPMAAVEIVHACDVPHLWVVYDNGGWQAVADAVHDQYDDPGFLDDAFVRFDPRPDYAGAVSGMGCHAERVADPAELGPALDRALDAVENGTHAVLDVNLG
jgi:acetolactate synthase-1/2/3 large subunit